MNWRRLVGTTFDALAISFTLGGVLSPPDPFTQLLYVVPTFVLSFPAVYLYGQQSIGPWWLRYLVFAGGILVVGLVWRVLALTVGLAPASDVRVVVLVAGVLLAGWLAYFGGLDRLRGSPAQTGRSSE